jgi:hypothetical protein
VTQRVSVRVMIETPDLASAAAAAGKLCTALAGYGEPLVLEIDRYWKFDRYFKAVIVLQVGDPGDALRRLTQALAPDWEWGRERDWAVWDPHTHGAFKIQSVAESCRWARVEVLPEGIEHASGV